jgi:glycosyltransferase involved in cell wall biosynthesis
VVAFDVGGIPEMIEHKVSGYLAEAFDTDDLARGIEYVLEQQQLNDQMHKAARKRAVENFSDREMSQKYMSLYETVTRPD